MKLRSRVADAETAGIPIKPHGLAPRRRLTTQPCGPVVLTDTQRAHGSQARITARGTATRDGILAKAAELILRRGVRA